MRRIGLLLLGWLAWASPALAVSPGTGITVNSGLVTLVVPVVVSSGGTGATTLGAHGILLGEGTSPIVSLTSCTTGQVPTCVSNGGADPTYQTPAAAIFPPVFFVGGMDITTSQTVFLGPGTGGMDQAEAVAQAISPAATYSNLRCDNGAIQGTGNNITITARVGACGSQADGTMTCTITGTTGANQTCTDVTHTAAPTVNQCWDLKVVTPGTLTANARVSCVVERTA